MKKKIFTQMILLISVGILLVSLVFCGIFYNKFTDQAREDLLERTQIFALEDTEGALINLRLVRADDMRVSLISPAGEVLFDNMASPEDLSSHLGREEIEEALAMGMGDSQRFSHTLGSQTYYYAVRLTDGTVLRTAKTVESIWQMFAGILPASVVMVLVFVLVGYAASKKVADRVVAPIGQMDFTGASEAPYDELSPFVAAVLSHRDQVEQSNQTLKSRTDTINAIMEGMNEGVVVLDGRGTILSLNQSAAAIFGTEDSMQGRSVLELLRDMDFSDKMQRALSGQRSEMSLSRGGKEYRVLLSPASNAGVIVFFLDVTERTRGEKLRREFSANVSHELKTPLTSIYGYTEMLREGVVKEEDRQAFYGKIMDEASRLMTLIEDIMMLSQLDERKVQERFEKIALYDIAAQCTESLTQKAEENGVTLHVEGEGIIYANPTQIHELVFNLMDNGIKYNRPGGKVDVSIQTAGDDVVLNVSDTGIGIDKKDRERVFERFYRVDKSRSKKSGGTGLGLAIVKHIAAVNRGKISLSSKPGEGTAFVVTFPAYKNL